MQQPQQVKVSPVVERGFQDALAKFKVRLTSAEHDKFKFTTLEDLRHAAREIQDKQSAKAESMNLARIQRFLEGSQQLSAVVEVFLNSSEFVAFVWGPMKFLLQVTSNYAERFDMLLHAYEQIGECLPLVSEHRELFTGNSHMDEVLAHVYRDILDFHRRALRIFQLPTWRQVFGSVWKNFSTHFEHILQDLRRHKELIESHAAVIHFRTYQEDRHLVIQKLKQVEADICNRQFQAIIQWLAPTNCTSDHDEISKVRKDSASSGGWLIKHPNYVAWRNDDVPKSPILWLNGTPGAGKSVLASRIVDDCKEEKTARTAFFYCKHGDDRRTTAISVLQTLLSQLLDPYHILLTWCFEQFLNSGQPSITSRTLCAELFESILASGDNIFLVIDGIDECSRDEQKLFFNTMNATISRCEIRSPGKVRIVLISQDEPDIRRHLVSATEITLKPSDNQQDIRAFVKRRCDLIRDRFRVGSEVFEHILESTCHYADGMFLFAELVMLNLYNQRCLADLEQQILPLNFPTDFRQAYARIVERINSNPNTGEREIAEQVLSWMTCAKRPLKWSEIQGAISIDVDNEAVDFRGRSSPIHIREICGSLIIHLTDDRLELVHRTAKHYLAESGYVKPLVSHARLAYLTLEYLSFPHFNPDLDRIDLERCLHAGYYAFMDYAIAHWSDHLVIAVQKILVDPPASIVDLKVELASAISAFAEHSNLQNLQTTDLVGNGEVKAAMYEASCQGFRSSQCYADLLHIFRFLAMQKSKGLDGLDDIGIPILAKTVAAARAILEDFALQSSIRQDNLKSRQLHVDRHERPFRCTFPECDLGFKLGFVNKRDLEKHMKFNHPEEGTLAVTFARIRKSKEKARQSPGAKEMKHPAKHACNLCDKRFTRASILRTHIFTSHENVRPHACVACGQRFARSNDLRRHMIQVHKDKASFVCQGTLKRGVPGSLWGCGVSFPGVDEYLGHMRTDAGKKCIQPLLEEEADERREKEQIEQRKAQGLKLPDPRRWTDSGPDGAWSNDASFPGTPGSDESQGINNINNSWKPFAGGFARPLIGITSTEAFRRNKLQSSQRTESGLSDATLITPSDECEMEHHVVAESNISRT